MEELLRVVFLELKLAMPGIRHIKDRVITWETMLAVGKQADARGRHTNTVTESQVSKQGRL